MGRRLEKVVAAACGMVDGSETSPGIVGSLSKAQEWCRTPRDAGTEGLRRASRDWNGALEGIRDGVRHLRAVVEGSTQMRAPCAVAAEASGPRWPDGIQSGTTAWDATCTTRWPTATLPAWYWAEAAIFQGTRAAHSSQAVRRCVGRSTESSAGMGEPFNARHGRRLALRDPADGGAIGKLFSLAGASGLASGVTTRRLRQATARTTAIAGEVELLPPCAGVRVRTNSRSGRR
jgi:hypothetical protein